MVVSVVLVALAVIGVSRHAYAQRDGRVGRRADRAAELTTLGGRFLQAGDRVSAAGYFREAIGVDPSFAPAYVALGELQLARGSLRDAEETFRVGVMRATPDARIWIGLARTLEAMGSTEDADAVLAQATSAFRDDETLLSFRARHAEQRGRWSLALALTRRLLALLSHHPEDGGPGEGHRAALRARERALSVLVGSLDPVVASRPDDLVRRALSSR